MRVTLNEESQAQWNRDAAERKRYEYPLSPGDVVIDLGAYRGEFARAIQDRYGCSVVVVEPTDSILGCPGRVINKAAATYDGLMRFGGAFYYTSAFEDANQSFPCFDINTLLEEYPEIALCKVNIEGGEYQVLQRILKGGYHRRIKHLQVQFHEIEGQPFEDWYEAIAKELSESHQMDWKYPYCWESWSRND